jgi:5-methyltetrahydrofolate--homocysteine methyltransferase
MRAAAPDLILIAKANAGMPRFEGEKLIYDGTPDVMAAYADRVRTNGISLIGGCCGSGPAHIRMMRQVLDGAIPVPDVTLAPVQAAPEVAPTRTRERRRRG